MNKIIKILKENKYLTFVFSLLVTYYLFYNISTILFTIISTILITIYFYYFSKDYKNRVWKILIFINFAPLLFYSFYFILIMATEIPFLVNLFIKYSLVSLFLLIIIVSLTFSLLFHKEEFFLERLKVSTRINTAIYLIITSLLLYYSYSINDFKTFFNQEALNNFKRFDITPRNAFLTLTQFSILPFLIANAFSIALVEYLQFRQKVKNSLKWHELL